MYNGFEYWVIGASNGVNIGTLGSWCVVCKITTLGDIGMVCNFIISRYWNCGVGYTLESGAAVCLKNWRLKVGNIENILCDWFLGILLLKLGIGGSLGVVVFVCMILSFGIYRPGGCVSSFGCHQLG